MKRTTIHVFYMNVRVRTSSLPLLGVLFVCLNKIKNPKLTFTMRKYLIKLFLTDNQFVL